MDRSVTLEVSEGREVMRRVGFGLLFVWVRSDDGSWYGDVRNLPMALGDKQHARLPVMRVLHVKDPLHL